MKNKQFQLIIMLLFFSVNSYSQIEGDVRSKENIPIPKALIVAKDTANNCIDSVITDSRGFYSFKTLPPGKYFIEAKAQGFEVRLYKNVIARERIEDPDAGNDISNATRLQIVLSPLKLPK